MIQLHSTPSSTLHVLSVLIKLGISTDTGIWLDTSAYFMYLRVSPFLEANARSPSMPRCSKCDLPQSLFHSLYIWSTALSIKISLSVTALRLNPSLPHDTQTHACTQSHEQRHTHQEHLIRFEWLMIEQAKRRWANNLQYPIFLPSKWLPLQRTKEMET